VSVSIADMTNLRQQTTRSPTRRNTCHFSQCRDHQNASSWFITLLSFCSDKKLFS